MTTIKKKEQPKEEEHEPAYINARNENLKEGKYCWFCDMPWYNCLCSHEDDGH